MAEKLNADQKRWRAESDAECMARYQEIMNDASRRNLAVKYAKQRASELTKSANAMHRVATNGKAVPAKKKK